METKDKKPDWKKWLPLIAIVLLIIFMNVMGKMNAQGDPGQEKFYKALSEEKLKSVEIMNRGNTTGLKVSYEEKTGKKGSISVLNSEESKNRITESAKKTNTKIVITEPSMWESLIPLIFQLGMWIGLMWFLMAKLNPGIIPKKQAPTFIKSKVKFSDVAGKVEEKEELQDILDFFKNYEEIKKRNISIPRGVLLEGPPGTGKTLLAKAVAGEVEANFFATVGSEFNGKFRGDGVSKVEALFKSARENAPAIIFIDEIDAVARKRGGGDSTANDTDQTVNQLLNEMDGFSELDDRVVVIATTNHSAALDPAVLRSGRFDRNVFVGNPNISERRDTFKYYLDKIKVDYDFNIEHIVSSTQGFSGADIELLINEANIHSFKAGRTIITEKDIDVAFNKIVAGVEKKSTVYTDDQKKIVANHEAGHAIVGKYLNEKTVTKVTIVPHGRAGGFALFTPNEERLVSTKENLLNEIAVSMGGRAGEEIFSNTMTSGVTSDLESATKIASELVMNYGMDGEFFFYKDTTPEKSGKKDSINEILNKQYEVAKNILTEKAPYVKMLSGVLVKNEVIYKDDIDKIYDMELEGLTDEEINELAENFEVSVK